MIFGSERSLGPRVCTCGAAVPEVVSEIVIELKEFISLNYKGIKGSKKLTKLRKEDFILNGFWLGSACLNTGMHTQAT